jgi:hypothetical protein
MFRVRPRPPASLDVEVPELLFVYNPIRTVPATFPRFERAQAVARSSALHAAMAVALVGVLGLMLQAGPRQNLLVVAAVGDPETTGSIDGPPLRPTLP